MSPPVIAVVQMRGIPGDPIGNRARTIAEIELAVSASARIIVLPELIISGYTLTPQLLQAASEPVYGDTFEAWQKLASKHDVVIAGGFCEKQDGVFYNSAMLIGPEGLIQHYQKLHLFDQEKLVFTPGTKGLKVSETKFGKIGLCVCYDLRFVEVVRCLALSGADLVAVPTAWVGGFDKIERDGDGLIGQARGAIVQANLNQVYMACASQAGATANHRFLGSSLITDPFGRLLSNPIDEDEERIEIAPLDRDLINQSRRRSDLITPRDDRRTDVYTMMLGGQRL